MAALEYELFTYPPKVKIDSFWIFAITRHVNTWNLPPGFQKLTPVCFEILKPSRTLHNFPPRLDNCIATEVKMQSSLVKLRRDSSILWVDNYYRTDSIYPDFLVRWDSLAVYTTLWRVQSCQLEKEYKLCFVGVAFVLLVVFRPRSSCKRTWLSRRTFILTLWRSSDAVPLLYSTLWPVLGP